MVKDFDCIWCFKFAVNFCSSIGREICECYVALGTANWKTYSRGGGGGGWGGEGQKKYSRKGI